METRETKKASFLTRFFEKAKAASLTLRVLRQYINRNTELAREVTRVAIENDELKAEIEQLRSDNAYLRSKADSLSFYYDRGVQAGKDTVMDAVRKVLAMTPEELKSASSAGRENSIYTEEIYACADDVPNEQSGRWAVYDRICQCGGCDMPSYYKDETNARIYTAILNTAKIPRVRDLCAECQQEYYADVV